MVTLALDTSNGMTVGVLDGVTELASRHLPTQRQHAERLSPLIEAVLTDAKISATAVDRVVVGTGPAPFTGLRAGLVAASVFAFARGVPVYGVCSLDAVALVATQTLDLADESTLVVLTDARRKEVYGRGYRVTQGVVGGSADARTVSGAADIPAAEAAAVDTAAAGITTASGLMLTPQSDPWVDRPDAAASRISKESMVVAPTALPILDGIGIELVGDDFTATPAALATIAQQRLAAGLDQPVEPLYLRRPDAQVPAQPKKAV